ncbi:MAG: hypothetical protein JWM47_3271 [Acidimicrobiales bacterium]|nr:hypothetical protein [Acidimicrobiales bacterium]
MHEVVPMTKTIPNPVVIAEATFGKRPLARRSEASGDRSLGTSLDGAARVAASLATAPLRRRRTNRLGAADGEVAAMFGAGHERPGRTDTETTSTWQWLLRPLRDGTATRLVSRQRYSYPRRTSALWRLVEQVSFVMERRVLLGIKARAEGQADARARAADHRTDAGGPVIDRVTPQDAVSLATDVGPAPMQVGAVLLLDGGARLDPEAIRTAIGERIRSVPRLRQRLVETPLGCGRPIWIDDVDFDVDRHVAFVRCPAPGDEGALLGLAADVIGARLPFDRPLWTMTFVTGLVDDHTAMVIAFHHVLADGIGGLAVLANLVDGVEPVPAGSALQLQPSTRVLAADAAQARGAAMRELPSAIAHLRSEWAQLRPATTARAARCSLNHRTGGRRRLTVVRVDLEELRRCAHHHDATVNDVVLSAAAGALRTLLASRGEAVDSVVASVPASARRHADSAHLGNEVGVFPVDLPAIADRFERLETIAERTRAAKNAMPATPTALLGPIFRLLAGLGMFGWFINRQQLVHTFITNLRGPDAKLSFLGAPISDVAAVALVPGNVTISFAALSYNGTLAITLIADPDVCPDLHIVRGALENELQTLISADRSTAASP